MVLSNRSLRMNEGLAEETTINSIESLNFLNLPEDNDEYKALDFGDYTMRHLRIDNAPETTLSCTEGPIDFLNLPEDENGEHTALDHSEKSMCRGSENLMRRLSDSRIDTAHFEDSQRSNCLSYVCKMFYRSRS